MTSEPLRTLALWMLLALAVSGLSFLGYRWRVRRSQRHALWRELCLRLELSAGPGEGRVASGTLQGIGFSLRDTGSRLLLEVALPQPLLPPGLVILLAQVRRLGSVFRLRRLQLAPHSAAPSPGGWYAGRELPPGKVVVSEGFLEEARRAMEAHAPLQVEPRRLVHTLRASPPLSVGDVREAVRTLDATARRWLSAVERHGLPRVEALPPAPSVLSRLPRVRIPRMHVRLPRVRIPLKRVLSVLGVLALLFSCCVPFFALMREASRGLSSDVTGQVVDIEWVRNVRQLRCPVPLMPVNGGDAGVHKSRCPQQWKDVDYVRATGRHGEPPSWPEPPDVRADDYLWREESYTLHIEYGRWGGKHVATYELRSEELYLLFSKPGQKVSFTLRNGLVRNLRPE